jgi:hypothetical protein
LNKKNFNKSNETIWTNSPYLTTIQDNAAERSVGELKKKGYFASSFFPARFSLVHRSQIQDTKQDSQISFLLIFPTELSISRNYASSQTLITRLG